MNKHITGIFILLSVLTLSLLACELVLRRFPLFSKSNKYYIWPPNLETEFHPIPGILPGIQDTSRFSVNADGFRSDPLVAEHNLRILAIGGSTTECTYLDQSETWTECLQNILQSKETSGKPWVGNAGLSGATTRHHLEAMKHLPLEELEIDILLLLIGINDFTKRLTRDSLYLSNYEKFPAIQKKLLAEAFRGSNLIYQQDPFYKKTAIWLLIRKAKQKIHLQLLGDKIEQDKNGWVNVIWRKHRRAASRIIDNLPDLNPALEEYARNISSMIDLAQQKSIRIIFMNQPTLWQAEMPQHLDSLLWFGGIGDFQNEIGKPYYSVEALIKGLKEYNQTLENICLHRGIDFLNLDTLLAKDTTVFYDDVHFNESGARKVAEILAAYLKNSNTLTLE